MDCRASLNIHRVVTGYNRTLRLSIEKYKFELLRIRIKSPRKPVTATILEGKHLVAHVLFQQFLYLMFG